MAAIEGYRFSIDLDDHGMSQTLLKLSREASTLSRIMRATSNESMAYGNTFSALSQKIEYSNKAIEGYNIVIEHAQKDMKNLPASIEETKQKLETLRNSTNASKEDIEKYNKQLDDEEKRHLSLVNKIENSRNAIARLVRQQQAAEQQQRLYNASLEQTRSVSAGMEGAMRSYSSLLKEEGAATLTTKGHVQALIKQRDLAKNQYSAEITQTKRLQTEITRLSGNYEHGKQSIANYKQQLASAKKTEAEMLSVHGKESDEYHDAQKAVNDLSNSLNKAKVDTSGYYHGVMETTSALQKQTGRTAEAAASVHRLSAAVKSVHGESWFGGLARGINNFDARIKASTSHTRAWASSVRNGAMMAGAAFTALGAGLGKSVQMAASLQQSWVTTRNLLQTGAKNAADARHEVGRVAEMQRDATKYSKQYGYSQKEVADQYTELVKRGYTANQSLGSMKSMLQAARASGDDFGDVVKNVSSTVDAFGMRTNNTSKMIERTRKVTNAMAYAADMTATDFKGMGEAMSYVSASAHQAGQTVETTTASVGELSNAGIVGTRAGTGMRKMLMSLVKPTAAATTELKKYGMTMDDFKNKDGSLKQLPDIMRIINEHVGKLGKADKGAFFKAVFGATGQQAAMVLSQNADAMDKLIKKEKEAERNNYVQNLAKKNMASTQMQMKQLQMQVQAFAIQIGSVLLPAVNKVGQAISKWAESNSGKATLKEFSDGVKSVGNTIANNAGGILSFLGGFASGIMDGFKAISIITTPFRWVVGEIGKLFGMVDGHSGGIAKFFGEVLGGLAGVTIAVKALRSLLGGFIAIGKDIMTFFTFKKQTSEAQKQDRLMQEMIDLQQKSIDLAEQQAQVQSGNTQSLKNKVAEEASSTEGAATTVTTATSEAEGAAASAGKVAGETAGVTASTGMIGKIMAAGGKFIALGQTIGGKIIAGVALVGETVDILHLLFKGATASSHKTRYAEAGKGIASAIVGGAVLYVSHSPMLAAMAAQMTSQGMNMAYKAVDGFKKGWNGYTKGYKPKGLVATIGWDFKDATRRYNNYIASVEKKHPVIAGYFRWMRGTWSTAFASVKFFIRNMHNGFKMGWDAISDIFTGHWGRIIKDWKKDNSNLMKGIKSDWSGFFSWFTKNRQKETIHKPKRNSSKDDEKTETRYKGTKVRYSKGDVATLKAMTTAIDNYKKSLKGLKDTVKHNDPTKEMNKMLSKLKGNVKGWEKLAKPIKKIGDAFKTLSTFSKSMSKKDAFAALNDDLPKLDKTLDKYGKDIKHKLDDLGKAFASKKLISPLKNLTKQIENSTKKWKAFDTPIKSLAKSFKTLQSATKTMAGKNGLESLQKGFTDLDNALKNQKIGKNLKSLATEIKKSGIDKKLSSMNSTVKNSAKNWKNLARPVNTAAKAFQIMAKAVDVLNGVGTGKQGKSKGSKSGLDGVARSVQNLSSTLKKYPFGQQIKNQAKLATDAMNGNSKKDGGFATQFTKMTNGMTTSIKNFGKAFKNNWAQPWKNLGRPVSQGMSSAESTLSHRLNAMQNKREDFSSAFLKGWNSWIDDVKTSFRRGFDKLPGYAESAMRKIIDRMNRGIGGVNKVIGDFGGDKKLSTISYANGTRGGHPGGHMLVNDSQGPHWKELVKFPGKQWTMFNERNTFIPNAPQGTQVLNGEVTHSIMNALGVHRYANGSLSDEEQEKMAEEFENNPKKAAKDLFLKETDWTSNVPVIADFGKAMAIGFSQAIANVLKDLLGEVKEPVNGDWTPVIKSAAAHMHVHLAEWQIQKLLRQIWTESKGVETQRQLGPSDDPDGDGSGRALGLLQFKRSTFNTWALPGHHNIFSGYDQIMAAIHALNSGGEGGWGNIGEGHGWANGGIVFSEQLSHVAEGGFPESIIPLDLNKRPRAQAILRKTVQAMDNDGGGSGLRSVGSNRQTNNYLKQVVAILGQIAGLNAEQVNAILSINPGTDMNNRRQRSKFFNQYGSDQRIRDYQAF